jgi:hypothetical protein
MAPYILNIAPADRCQKTGQDKAKERWTEDKTLEALLHAIHVQICTLPMLYTMLPTKNTVTFPSRRSRGLSNHLQSP